MPLALNHGTQERGRMFHRSSELGALLPTLDLRIRRGKLKLVNGALLLPSCAALKGLTQKTGRNTQVVWPAFASGTNASAAGTDESAQQRKVGSEKGRCHNRAEFDCEKPKIPDWTRFLFRISSLSRPLTGVTEGNATGGNHPMKEATEQSCVERHKTRASPVARAPGWQ
jgi:hypothetical protein